MGYDTVLPVDIANGNNGHAGKHNAVNAQVNYLTEQTTDLAASIDGLATTKRVTMPISGDGSATYDAFNDVGGRAAVLLPSTTTRWRVRLANQLRGTTSPITGALTFTGLYLGTPSLAADGAWAGAFTAAPTLAAAAGATASNGAEYVSAWVTDPALQFQAHKLSAVAWGITCASGQVLAAGPSQIAYAYYFTGAAAAASGAAAPAGSSSASAQFADIRIEYEAHDSLPVVLVVSDSTGSGAIDGPLSPDVFGQYHTWPGQAGLRNNFHVVNASTSGATYADFLDATKWSWARFDLATTVPDAAIFGSGINEAGGNATVAAWRANACTARGVAVTKGIKRTMITTIMVQPQFKPGYLRASIASGVTSLPTTIAYASGDSIDVGYSTGNYERVTASGDSTVVTTGGYATPVSATTKAHASGDTTGLPSESLRTGYNTAARGLFGGFEAVYDFAAAVKPSDPLYPWFAGGQIHPGAGMYALLGGLVKIT